MQEGRDGDALPPCYPASPPPVLPRVRASLCYVTPSLLCASDYPGNYFMTQEPFVINSRVLLQYSSISSERGVKMSAAPGVCKGRNGASWPCLAEHVQGTSSTMSLLVLPLAPVPPPRPPLLETPRQGHPDALPTCALAGDPPSRLRHAPGAQEAEKP
ncbi:hypothetical protein E2C01_070459 [Portunus trituberculatus]|uniref:Uncharacterized protein n=1 Tax=Portunus trituberculatus TaxID=210409 RepID=A0A5B7I5B6_PORTR|nr:hypothetical protein [Portunus trituberculatus]